LSGSITSLLAGYTTLSFGKKITPLNSTPDETPGPFYPITEQEDKDYDLTQISEKSKSALGEIIWVETEIVDLYGRPLKNVTVELWQANAVGRYRHPSDSSQALIDPNFQGWAIVKTNEQGYVKFKTIFPGSYPASRNWTRPPHIHFKLYKQGYRELTTQMYFPSEPLNDKDRLLNRKSDEEKKLMIAKQAPDHPKTYRHRFILASLRNNSAKVHSNLTMSENS